MKIRDEIFKAQVENVRELERAWTHVNRQINALILKENKAGIDALTKVLAIIYCAFAEALFSRLVHIPNGLDDDGIEQIQTTLKKTGVTQAWLKCAELALLRVEGGDTSHKPKRSPEAQSTH
jgi:hypothetical protein